MNKTAVIVDPQPLWLEAVQGVLQKLDFEVVGKTTNSADALALIRETSPDLLVAEISGHEGESSDAGLRLLERSGSHSPAPRIVVLSTCDAPEEIDAALRAGARAYVVKSVHPDDLASAIRQVFEHSVYLAYAGNGHGAGAVNGSNGNGKANGAEHVDLRGLTRRELEILRLVAEGHSNAGLARMLWVTEQTVKFHLSNIYRKLDVSNRTEASRWAQLNGLLQAREVKAEVA